jgi:hypothetical protein
MMQNPVTPEYWQQQSRAVVEATASGATSASGAVDVRQVGLARAELLRRDQEYSEGQEAGRRAWEAEREQSRRTFEIKMFEAAGNRAAIQQEHEEKLARMQANTAREAALIQAQATEKAAETQTKVARGAAAAAVAAAVAAFLSLAVTVALAWIK